MKNIYNIKCRTILKLWKNEYTYEKLDARITQIFYAEYDFLGLCAGY